MKYCSYDSFQPLKNVKTIVQELYKNGLQTEFDPQAVVAQT